MASELDRETALLESVKRARSTFFWVRAVVAGAIVAGLIAAIGMHHGNLLGNSWWFFQGFGGLATAIGVKLGARRARGAVRQLPDPVAAEVLRPLVKHQDEATRRVAKELMKHLRPEGTEVVAAPAPEGSGSEIASAPPPDARRTA